MLNNSIWFVFLIGVVVAALVMTFYLLIRSRIRWQTRYQAEKLKSDRLELQLVQSQRFEAVGVLAGSIVHNLNNLMSVILGHTRMVAHDLPDKTPAQQDLQQVIKAGHMATDLLNEISDFNRQAEQALKPTDLSALTRDILKFMRDILPSSIEIREEFPASCEPVMASATGFQQVLMNLISNSVQAIGNKPGLIQISLHDSLIQHPHRGTPRNLEPGNYLRLSVRDNGQGMSGETLDQIIDSYHQSPPDTTRLGLGLNTVLRVLDDHEGVAIPQSIKGKGTTFDVYFPKIAWRVEGVGPVVRAPITGIFRTVDPSLGKTISVVGGNLDPAARDEDSQTAEKELATVLLVDDEEMVARVTAIGLQRLGYRVIKHLDSRKALADFVQTPELFDVVVTDQIMPHMSGVRLARKIHGVRPDIPVLLMTGFRDSFNDQQALEAGISQIVLKPTSHRDLADVIERIRLRRQESRG